MKKEKEIKLPKDYFKSLNFEINWDWDLFFKINRLAILQGLKKPMTKKEKKIKYLFGVNLLFGEDYPRYCFENLPEEYERLRKEGGTGVEAFIFAKEYENRLKNNLMTKETIKIWGLLTKDAYLDLEKYPPHLAEITLLLEEFEKIIEERLNKLGVEFARCKKCGKKIFFLPTKAGKQMPITLGLISHFADCPNAKEFRK